MCETAVRDRLPRRPWRLMVCALSVALAACSNSGSSGSGASGGATTASGGTSATSAKPSSGSAGTSTPGSAGAGGAGGSGGSSAGGTSSVAATASTGGGASGAKGGGAGGSTGVAGAGGSATGGSAAREDGGVQGGSTGADAAVDRDGSAAADAGFGACPTTLPPLAADNDTSFYANKPNIPHGTVATVKYASDGTTMHIYTPPDYASNTSARYPVLYLNHGIGETDGVYACTTGGPECGYAGWILDNLLAAGKAVPMIMVMTDTRKCADLVPAKPPTDDACTTHYRQVLMPYVEKNYRTINDRDHRAIGGLSLGGVVSFNVGLSHLDLFSQLFIYSSGFFDDTRATWEANMSAVFKDPKTTNHLLNVPIYMAAGDTDVALANAKACYEILKKNGIKALWQQSTLDHSWVNWRRYLAQTLPLMFTNSNGCD